MQEFQEEAKNTKLNFLILNPNFCSHGVTKMSTDVSAIFSVAGPLTHSKQESFAKSSDM